jgi:hypothetical protein
LSFQLASLTRYHRPERGFTTPLSITPFQTRTTCHARDFLACSALLSPSSHCCRCLSFLCCGCLTCFRRSLLTYLRSLLTCACDVVASIKLRHCSCRFAPDTSSRHPPLILITCIPTRLQTSLRHQNTSLMTLSSKKMQTLPSESSAASSCYVHFGLSLLGLDHLSPLYSERRKVRATAWPASILDGESAEEGRKEARCRIRSSTP